jgi:hypothetical protein
MSDDESQLSSALPQSLKGLRACMVCSLVKSFEQFYNDVRVRPLVSFRQFLDSAAQRKNAIAVRLAPRPARLTAQRPRRRNEHDSISHDSTCVRRVPFMS